MSQHARSKQADLQAAVQQDDGTVVRNILGRDPSASPEIARDALINACRFGKVEAAKAVLENDPGGTIIKQIGPNLLHDACLGGHVAMARLLLMCGVDPEAKNNRQWCPCHTAAYHGEVACLEALVGHGVDCDAKDPQGQTPCHMAAEKNHPQILEFLVQQGYDLELTNVKGQRPVHLAAKHGALECLILFTQMDCDTNAKDSNGRTPAHYAAGGDHISCLRFLLQHGANKESLDNSQRTLAHSAASNGAMTCLHWLLDKNIEMINLLDKNKNTPAHLAAAGGHAKCFHCCLQHGTDLSLENNRRENPTETGRRYGHPLIMEKACKNQIQCVHCKDTFELLEWERTHQPNIVQQMVSKSKKTIFTSPLPKIRRGDKKKPPRANSAISIHKDQENINLQKRDLVARYFVDEQDTGN